VATLTIPVVHALPGAVPPRGKPLKMLLGNQELLLTRQASLLRCQLPCTIVVNDKKLINKAMVTTSSDIAALASGDKVIQGVIRLISVDMINYKAAFASPSSRDPIDQGATPVTGVGSWTDFPPKKYPMLWDTARCSRERMISENEVSVGRHRPRLHEVM
jgi:hypothetical protein